MAGDWIKMRCDLPEDPAVIAVAAAVGLDELAVVGRLHRLWSWASKQSRDGHAPGVTVAWLDAHLRAPGFADALANAGWLTVNGTGISIPNFDRHNSKSAKTRALASQRKSRSRHAPVTQRAGRKRDQRREEKSKRNGGAKSAAEVPQDPGGGGESAPPAAAVFGMLQEFGFAETDPIFEHANATPGYVRLLLRNLALAKPKNPRGWLVEGICAGNYTLDPRVEAAEREARSRNTDDQKRAAEKRAEVEQLAAEDAECQRFEAWVGELPDETRERMIDEAIEGLDDIGRHLHFTNGQHRTPLKMPLRLHFFTRWKDMGRRGGGTVAVGDVLRDEGT